MAMAIQREENAQLTGTHDGRLLGEGTETEKGEEKGEV